jgi:hypothetical protein
MCLAAFGSVTEEIVAALEQFGAVVDGQTLVETTRQTTLARTAEETER